MNFSFKPLMQDFQKLKTEDSFSNVCGFIYGLCAKGLEAGNREFNTKLSQFFNDDLPLPGVFIAVSSNLALEIQGRLVSNQKLAFPFDEIEKSQEKLESLGQFAYGLSLALGLSKDQSLNNDLHMLSEISLVETNDDMSEDDFKTIRNYIEELIVRVNLERQKIASAHA